MESAPKRPLLRAINPETGEVMPLHKVIESVRLAINTLDAPEAYSVAQTLARIEDDLANPSFTLYDLSDDPNLNDLRVIDALLLGLSHEEEDVGSSYIDLLTEVKRPDIEDILINAYETTENPIQRMQLLWSLRDFVSTKVTDLLLKVLEEPSFSSGLPSLSSSHIPAFRFLSGINSLKAIDGIIDFLNRDDIDQKRFRDEFLGHFGHRPYLLSLELLLKRSDLSPFVQELLRGAIERAQKSEKYA